MKDKKKEKKNTSNEVNPAPLNQASKYVSPRGEIKIKIKNYPDRSSKNMGFMTYFEFA